MRYVVVHQLRRIELRDHVRILHGLPENIVVNDTIFQVESGHDVTSISDLVTSYIFRFSKLYGKISLDKNFIRKNFIG